MLILGKEGVPVCCEGPVGDAPDPAPPQESEENKAKKFQKDLERLINYHSLEGMCGNTPDFILAQYLTDCLWNFARITERREQWYGRENL